MTEIIYSPDRQMVSLVIKLINGDDHDMTDIGHRLVKQWQIWSFSYSLSEVKTAKKSLKCIKIVALENTTEALCVVRVHLSGWRENRSRTCRELMQCWIQR